MKAWYSLRHRGHAGLCELTEGRLQASFERPERADAVIEALISRGIVQKASPRNRGLDPILAVHDAAYVHFLKTAWTQWSITGRDHPALPMVWPVGPERTLGRPASIDGLLGYYAQDAACAIVAGSWDAIYGSAQCAIEAALQVAAGTPSAVAVCRPPGHHATRAAMGGFCYLNNAAIAAQLLRDRTQEQVAVLDIDYHHGNGTQSIFWERSDVFVASVHVDPREDYPFYQGYAEEQGDGPGWGSNFNLPLPRGTDGATWLSALNVALARVQEAGPSVLVVSVGLDTAETDPVGSFRLKGTDYAEAGRRIGLLRLPTVFVLEGGYDVQRMGIHIAELLEGFDHGQA